MIPDGLGYLEEVAVFAEESGIVDEDVDAAKMPRGLVNQYFYVGTAGDIGPDKDGTGAGALQRFFYVTIPLLRNAITFVLVYTIIGSMKFFDLIFVATNGGPNEASTVVGLRIYWHSMREGRFNYAATMSTILTIVILALSVVVIRQIVTEDEED